MVGSQQTITPKEFHMSQTRDLVRRNTAITEAFIAALAKQGIDASSAKTPKKYEPTWRVTRRK
jgi:hypothetical protein